ARDKDPLYYGEQTFRPKSRIITNAATALRILSKACAQASSKRRTGVNKIAIAELSFKNPINSLCTRVLAQHVQKQLWVILCGHPSHEGISRTVEHQSTFSPAHIFFGPNKHTTDLKKSPPGSP